MLLLQILIINPLEKESHGRINLASEKKSISKDETVYVVNDYHFSALYLYNAVQTSKVRSLHLHIGTFSMQLG